MKKSGTKTKKRVVAMIATLCMAVSQFPMGILATDTESEDAIRENIIRHVKSVNRQMGITMTKEDVISLKEEITEAANEYVQTENISSTQSYQKILDEVKQETPLSKTRSSSSSSGGGNKIELPLSETGNIFFTDSGSAWNHVGLYISNERIIEAMPKDGVQKKSIYDDSAKQNCVRNNGDESCILSVKGTTYVNNLNVCIWASEHEKKPYDNDFINNKKNTTSENAKFNCAELVWKAYKFGKDVNIDLDSNDGFAVYPNNILDSDKVNHVEDF